MTSPCRQCERRRGGGGEKWSLQGAPPHRIIISMLVPGSTDLRGSNSTLERRDRRSFVHASSRSVGVASWFRLWQPATFGRARHRHTDTRRGGAFGRLKDATVSLADRQGVRQPGWLIPPGARRARGTRVQPNAPSAALLTAALSESQTSWSPFLLTTTRRAGRAAAAPSGRGRLLLHYGQLGHHRRHGLHGGCLWGWRGGDGACGRGVVQGGGAREERRRSPTPPATPRVCGSGGSAAAHRGGGRRGGCPPLSRRTLLFAAVAVVGRGGGEVGWGVCSSLVPALAFPCGWSPPPPPAITHPVWGQWILVAPRPRPPACPPAPASPGPTTWHARGSRCDAAVPRCGSCRPRRRRAHPRGRRRSGGGRGGGGRRLNAGVPAWLLPPPRCTEVVGWCCARPSQFFGCMDPARSQPLPQPAAPRALVTRAALLAVVLGS